MGFEPRKNLGFVAVEAETISAARHILEAGRYCHADVGSDPPEGEGSIASSLKMSPFVSNALLILDDALPTIASAFRDDEDRSLLLSLKPFPFISCEAFDEQLRAAVF